MKIYRDVPVEIIPWDKEDPKHHVTHALVTTHEGREMEVWKTARSLEEAQHYLRLYVNYGMHALLPSEVSKYMDLLMPYLEKPCLDLGSGGYPVVDYAIQVEQNSDAFNAYTAGRRPDIPIQIHGDIANLPFKDNTIGGIVASHLIEDWPRSEWPRFFREWRRVLRPGGYLLVLVPERSRWWHCVNEFGQIHNFSHAPGEPLLGDITEQAKGTGLVVLSEKLTDAFPWDYSILGILQKH